MMNVRNANTKDFEQIMKIYKYAQDYMIQLGRKMNVHNISDLWGNAWILQQFRTKLSAIIW